MNINKKISEDIIIGTKRAVREAFNVSKEKAPDGLNIVLIIGSQLAESGDGQVSMKSGYVSTLAPEVTVAVLDATANNVIGTLNKQKLN